MIKIIALLAIVLCAQGQVTMQDMLQRVYNTQQFMNQQQEQQLQIINYLMDLEEQTIPMDQITKAGEAAQGISSALTGTLTIMQQWQTFTGGIISSSGLKEKVDDLTKMQKDLTDASGSLATEALTTFNAAIWGIDKNIRSIQSLASQLKGGCENVKMITNEVMKSPSNALTGEYKQMYDSALNLLIVTLKRANDNSNTITGNLDKLVTDLNTCIGKMQLVQLKLSQASQGQGEEYKKMAMILRLSIYGATCGTICGSAAYAPAAPVSLPLCVTCFASAAPILELSLMNWRNKIAEANKSYKSWGEFFMDMGKKTSEAKDTAIFWYGKIGEFNDKVVVVYDFAKSQQSILYIAQTLRENFSKQLDSLVVACDDLISQTKGRLVGETIKAKTSQLIQFSGLTHKMNEGIISAQKELQQKRVYNQYY